MRHAILINTVIAVLDVCVANRDLVVEEASVPALVPRPGHGRHEDTVDPAGHSGCVGFEVDLHRAGIQRPPPAPPVTSV